AARVAGLDDPGLASAVTVTYKPGVMDPAALSVVRAAGDLGFALAGVRTFRRYMFDSLPEGDERTTWFRRVLANEAVEQVVLGRPRPEHLTLDANYTFKKVDVPLADLDDAGLLDVSRRGQLALSLDEMRTIQGHYRDAGRAPSDIELETIAQTWSEHCSHKTLKGRVECDDGTTYRNLLKETIFAATVRVRELLGEDDWCVSVFEDNAGVVRWSNRSHVCFKVETHNRPSAIEPYGGANTGLGGVIRDVLGCGKGAKPVANTDVFCVAPPDIAAADLPPGVLHPKKVLRGVVRGVADYGNRTGIPTVNGAVIFHPRYLANPLVFCGTVGLLPVGSEFKKVHAGDRIVVVGGRTGRDGIHGATFSSAGLGAESESVGGGAVQIGNAIEEKKFLDVLLQARDRGLYSAVTDCGAGGLSSAVGEMGADVGATVHLDRAPLKYAGLSYTEIWISEAQERMVLAVPPDRWHELHALCAAEGVEATDLGEFTGSGRLKLYYGEHLVGDLAMEFLHDGRPPVTRKAILPKPQNSVAPALKGKSETWAADALKAILAAPSVRSKESIIRRYDHEVQGGSVIKPLVGIREDGPGDAAVIAPDLGLPLGLAVGCGLNPRYGELDPYAMAALAIDEAVRNLIAVGADPRHIAVLDNFCWGNTDDPATLGALVRACEACRDLAIAWRMPFISGKDSLHNEYKSGSRHIAIPGTLLISAIGRVPDVTRCVSMDLKAAGNVIYLIGSTADELGGSHYFEVTGLSGGTVPQVDVDRAAKLFRVLHAAIVSGLVRSCHDLSEGGLAVAAAEMAFAGGIGADLNLSPLAGISDEARLFSESATRWLVEVEPDKAEAFEEVMHDLPCFALGKTVRESRLRIAGSAGDWLIWARLDELKAAWQTPLGL
ncbi:MAG: phosphoribosylformylglycinamidine synthase subunit PurL, partial [Gemmataceae bacterium]|nr:phosphoribosylformylglycinamidine synthase subunit PurL [Gemmataceae bacterium]